MVVLQLLFTGTALAPSALSAGAVHTVPLNRLFEVTVKNTATKVADPFGDVWLNATFAGPPAAGGSDAQLTRFWGFYDGDATWRLRFMPSAVGRWTYHWSFSDRSLEGEGTFECVPENASPGVLRPYRKNPHWFAYNGETPVFLKSYYNKAGGSQRQGVGFFKQNFYSKLAARQYNHHMASGFLPVLPLAAFFDGQPFSDPGAPTPINRTIYTDPASPQTSMSLDVWATLEGHLSALNDLDISVQFFQGFNAQGPGAGNIQWSALSDNNKRWWVAYVVARLAPFANLGGYQ